MGSLEGHHLSVWGLEHFGSYRLVDTQCHADSANIALPAAAAATDGRVLDAGGDEARRSFDEGRYWLSAVGLSSIPCWYDKKSYKPVDVLRAAYSVAVQADCTSFGFSHDIQ